MRRKREKYLHLGVTPGSPTVSEVISDYCERDEIPAVAEASASIASQEKPVGTLGSPTSPGTSDIISDHCPRSRLSSTPRSVATQPAPEATATPILPPVEPELGRTRAQTRALQLNMEQDDSSSSEEYFTDESTVPRMTGPDVHSSTLYIASDTIQNSDATDGFNLTIEDNSNFYSLIHVPVEDYREPDSLDCLPFNYLHITQEPDSNEYN